VNAAHCERSRGEPAVNGWPICLRKPRERGSREWPRGEPAVNGWPICLRKPRERGSREWSRGEPAVNGWPILYGSRVNAAHANGLAANQP